MSTSDSLAAASVRFDDVMSDDPSEALSPLANDRPATPAAGCENLGAIYLVWVSLVVLAALTLSVTLALTLVGRLQYDAAQHRQFDQLRTTLATGTAPIGQTEQAQPGAAAGGVGATEKTELPHLLALGTPVALMKIPSLGLSEVIGEGTTGQVLTMGPGHRRDTPMPGQAWGTAPSVIMGRAAAYGGPFGRLHSLRVGAPIVVTTGEGVSTFKVIDVRRAGAPTPPPLKANQARLTLETATGTPFVPSGVLLVDADLTSPVLASPSVVLPLGSIPTVEKAMATDTATLWELLLWLQALIILAVGAVWSWTRWGHQQTWIVFFPMGVLVGHGLSDQVIRLLPNLL